jgi:alkaline phosphatase D
MTRLTRRGALGFGVAGLGAGLGAACTTTGEAAYAGKAAFGHGVASGDPTQTAVILWTRVTPEACRAGSGDVEYRARSAAMKDVVKKGAFTTGPERDYTVKDRCRRARGGAGLLLLVHGRADVVAGGVTRTLPATGVADYRMAVVSCSNWPFGYFNVYREIAKRGQAERDRRRDPPGDYIYEYGQSRIWRRRSARRSAATTSRRMSACR